MGTSTLTRGQQSECHGDLAESLSLNPFCVKGLPFLLQSGKTAGSGGLKSAIQDFERRRPGR
jgi:hypothetical protein